MSVRRKTIEYELIAIVYEVKRLGPLPGIIGRVESGDGGKSWRWVKTRGKDGQSSYRYDAPNYALDGLRQNLKELGEEHDS
jgi:hypothetical protein